MVDINFSSVNLREMSVYFHFYLYMYIYVNYKKNKIKFVFYFLKMIKKKIIISVDAIFTSNIGYEKHEKAI